MFAISGGFARVSGAIEWCRSCCCARLDGDAERVERHHGLRVLRRLEPFG